jgi:hypothetical protein
MIVRPELVLAALFLLAGCGGAETKQPVAKPPPGGEDIRDVTRRRGTPVQYCDLKDGRRAFQWFLGGGAYVVFPQLAAVPCHQSFVDSWAGPTVPSSGCYVTYFAVPGQTQGSWIVTGVVYPANTSGCN